MALTEQQMRWAASHDWFIGRFGDTIEVVDRWTEADGTYHECNIIWRESFAALRDWAGY